MDIVHALADGTACGGLGLCFVAQPVSDRRESEFCSAVARRQAHGVAQFACASGKVPQLVQNQAHQTTDRRAIQSAGDRLGQHVARFAASALIQQEPGFAQGLGDVRHGRSIRQSNHTRARLVTSG